jgi:hypothetical protein
MYDRIKRQLLAIAAAILRAGLWVRELLCEIVSIPIVAVVSYANLRR